MILHTHTHTKAMILNPTYVQVNFKVFLLFLLEVPTRSLHEPTGCQSISMGTRCPRLFSLALWLSQMLPWDSEQPQCHFPPRLLSPVCLEQEGNPRRRENRDLLSHAVPPEHRAAGPCREFHRPSQEDSSVLWLASLWSWVQTCPPYHTQNGCFYHFSQDLPFSPASFPC